MMDRTVTIQTCTPSWASPYHVRWRCAVGLQPTQSGLRKSTRHVTITGRRASPDTPGIGRAMTLRRFAVLRHMSMYVHIVEMASTSRMLVTVKKTKVRRVQAS